MQKNNKKHIYFYMCIFIVFIILIAGFFYVSKTTFTGFAAGYVNLTVNTQVTINVTSDTVDWGSGTVGAGFTNATLTTHGPATSTVSGGNWSTDARPIALSNIGNVNCSLKLQGVKTAATFFGGSAGNQLYQWNISNKDPGSCGVWGELSAKNVFADVNTSQATICDQLDYHRDSNEVYIDFRLVVPYDATVTGAQFDVITITGDAAS